ncbi:MAG: hypothetical protein QM426_00110 [Euryarchaeota archaeon]|nr:hypothetical protein [Euryarchaeota archaeon]
MNALAYEDFRNEIRCELQNRLLGSKEGFIRLTGRPRPGENAGREKIAPGFRMLYAAKTKEK